MSQDLWVRIRARNESGNAFEEVGKDARDAATAVEGASARASTALNSQSRALATLGKSSGMAAMQQKNLLFQLNDIGVSLAGGANPLMVAAQQGGQLATIYGPEEGGLGRAFTETGKMATGLVTKFWPIAAAVAAGSAALAGMTHEINKTGGAQVTFGDVAMATWQQFTGGIYDMVQPAIKAVTGWLGGVWDASVPVLKGFGNAIVGTFVGAFDAAVAVWSTFPAAIGDMAISAANNVIGGVESMINGTIGLINDFNKLVNLPQMSGLDFGGIENPYAGALGGMTDNAGAAFGKAMGTDYLGMAFDGIATKAKALAKAREEVDATKSSVAGLAGAGRGLGAAFNDTADTIVSGIGAAKAGFGEFASEASGLLSQIFQGNKTAAIAGAVLDASAGIAKTLSAYPYPFNLGMAALHAAAAVAQINKIKSTSETSTSVDAGVAAGGSAPAAPAAGGGIGQGLSITLVGDTVPTARVADMLKQLQDYLGVQGKALSIVHRNGA